MSPRYNPLLTDGQIQRSIYDWQKFAKSKGYIFEPVEMMAPIHYRIMDCTVPGKPRVIKSLNKIEVTRIIK